MLGRLDPSFDTSLLPRCGRLDSSSNETGLFEKFRPAVRAALIRLPEARCFLYLGLRSASCAECSSTFDRQLTAQFKGLVSVFEGASLPGLESRLLVWNIAAIW